MTTADPRPTLGEAVLHLLEAQGVRHVFGIPGVHNAELYRGFAAAPRIRHITPRHEQGAGFMADGYARRTGKPGVCFVISGPGLTNISTALVQARNDSIPLLVISTCQPPGRLGTGNGYLHELLDQQGLGRQLVGRSTTAKTPQEVPGLLQEAFALFASARPGPVHIDIPTVFLEQRLDLPKPMAFPAVAPPVPTEAQWAEAQRLLDAARHPLILAGGGARFAAAPLRALAERLDAPVCMTVNGRGLLPPGHPLGLSYSASLPAVRRLIAQSDGILAVGTELGQTDYDMYDDGGFQLPAVPLIRVDIAAEQLERNARPTLGLLGDAAQCLAELARRCAPHAASGAAARVRETAQAARAELPGPYARLCTLLERIREAVPGIIMVGDSTQLGYAGSLGYAAGGPGEWFSAATGYGTLGYSVPAAVGASLGESTSGTARPVVALVGDGGLQFTLAELASAQDAGCPVMILLWNNRGYGEIKSYLLARSIAPVGVDLYTPDFQGIAAAYGWRWNAATTADAVVAALREAAGLQQPSIIEVNEAEILADLASR